MKSLKSVQTVRTDLLEQAQAYRMLHSYQTERVPLMHAFGRIIDEDCFSAVAAPPADNSAMDGYAVDSKTAGNGSVLSISQTIRAGDIAKPLTAGTCARILTGGEIPRGADAVIIQENCTVTDAGVQFNVATKADDNVRKKGQDIVLGSRILTQGHRLTPQDVALLASSNMSMVSVIRPLKVALMSTGNELILPGKPLAPGQIYNSNRFLLTGLLRQLGMDIIIDEAVSDTLETTCDALSQAARVADVIISTGGVSVGDADFIKPAVKKLGQIDQWKVALKPGKPIAFGQVESTPFVGLPGNPVSAFVTFVLLLRPYLQQLQGEQIAEVQVRILPANFSKKKATRRDEYLRGKITAAGVIAHPQQSSGALSSVTWADCLIWVPAGEIVTPGQKVKVLPMQQWQ